MQSRQMTAALPAAESTARQPEQVSVAAKVRRLLAELLQEGRLTPEEAQELMASEWLDNAG